IVKLIFPLVILLVSAICVPDSAALIGMLMFGNLLRESGVTERLSKTAQNELINIITIFLGLAVGSSLTAANFLKQDSLFIFLLGLFSFMFGTAGGIIIGKILCKLTKGKINPLIGAAGVSAVPMAARVVQKIGQKENPSNFLLMHAMGPNVAGVIGSAVAAGILLAIVKN
ncbi:MAG TPA: sodium ion-translocating decarboxylase subunit beta, partial [bacterium]|nr:sodium ion-translocating decarboxylase subunit beta [bacterium]